MAAPNPMPARTPRRRRHSSPGHTALQGTQTISLTSKSTPSATASTPHLFTSSPRGAEPLRGPLHSSRAANEALEHRLGPTASIHPYIASRAATKPFCRRSTALGWQRPTSQARVTSAATSRLRLARSQGHDAGLIPQHHLVNLDTEPPPGASEKPGETWPWQRTLGWSRLGGFHHFAVEVHALPALAHRGTPLSPRASQVRPQILDLTARQKRARVMLALIHLGFFSFRVPG